MNSIVSRLRSPGRGWAAAGLFAALLAGGGPAHAQGIWTTYLNSSDSRAVAADGDGVWAAGNGGAIRFPRGATGQPLVLNRTPDGLASDHITAVRALPDGSVWFGTEDQGLSRWDRRINHWETVDVTLGLPDNHVTRVTDDGQYLWVGTVAGFAIFSGDTLIQTCASLQDSCLPDLYVNDILIGTVTHGAGPYFFATRTGVTAFDGNQWLRLTRGLPPNTEVKALAQLGSQLFAAVNRTLYAYGDTGWSVAATSSDVILSLLAAGGQLYVGRNGGASVLAPSGDALNPLLSGGQELFSPVRQMVAVGDTLWAAALNDPQRYAAGHWQDLYALYRVDKPALNNIEDMRFETVASHRLWLTGRGSVSAMNYDPTRPAGAQWTSLGPPTLEGVQVFPVLPDRNGHVWVGHCCTDETNKAGLDELDPSVNPPALVRRRLLPPHNVLAAAEGPDGKLWFGSGGATNFDGLFVISPTDDPCAGFTADSVEQILTNRYGRATLSSLRQIAFAFRGANDRWIGTVESGLDLWRVNPAACDTNWYQFNFSSPGTYHLVGDGIRSLLIQGDSLWVGTTQGMSLLDAVTPRWLADFSTGDGTLPDNTVKALALGPNGDVWIGTSRGLTLRRNGTFQTFTTLNSPLVNDEIHALAVDATRSPYELWIGTAFGVSRLAVSAGGGGGCPPDCPQAGSGALHFYPHPFRPGRAEQLHLGGDFLSAANVRIYDARGRVVRELDGVVPDQAFWDGRDAQGQVVGSGLYRVRVEADGQIHRMLLAVVR